MMHQQRRRHNLFANPPGEFLGPSIDASYLSFSSISQLRITNEGQQDKRGGGDQAAREVSNHACGVQHSPNMDVSAVKDTTRDGERSQVTPSRDFSDVKEDAPSCQLVD